MRYGIGRAVAAWLVREHHQSLLTSHLSLLTRAAQPPAGETIFHMQNPNGLTHGLAVGDDDSVPAPHDQLRLGPVQMAAPVWHYPIRSSFLRA
jgi:hypothetical protein